MSRPKISVAIPYRRRLDNIRLAFEALAEQDLPRGEFEVVVGAMEYAHDYTELCRSFADRLDVVSATTSRPFSIPRARNLGMRQAQGEVVVQMDADTLLPPDALRTLYETHFADGQDQCVVGQVLGYGNNQDGDTAEVAPLSYLDYRANVPSLVAAREKPRDPRFQVEHVIPWAFGWTGLIALRLDTVRRHELWFDETFEGWGVDDLEWSFRIDSAGIPIRLAADAVAFHLPHRRDAGANRRSESLNYRRFLAKWPRLDVELAHAVGDMEANRQFRRFSSAVAEAGGGGGGGLAVVCGRRAGKAALAVGARTTRSGALAQPARLPRFDRGVPLDVHPLAGVALPFNDRAFGECHVLEGALDLPTLYRDLVRSEAARVADRVVLPTPAIA